MHVTPHHSQWQSHGDGRTQRLMVEVMPLSSFRFMGIQPLLRLPSALKQQLALYCQTRH